MRRLLAIVCVLFVLACQQAQEGPPDAATPSDTIAESSEPQGNDHDDQIPNREAEVARDEGSRPQEVMDFLGLERGDSVADVFAGGGYFTYLLSERVGSSGRVYAQGYSPGLKARVERGDLANSGNVALVDSLSHLPEDALDGVLLIRAYHLFPDPQALFSELHRSLKPGGVIGVVEVRLNQEFGHDMETHRMGDQTLVDEFEAAGFEFIGTSDVLRNPEDDHTEFWEGRRHLTDRMLVKFSEPGEPAPATPSTAQRNR